MSRIHEPERCLDGRLRSRVGKFQGNNELRVQAFVVQLGRLSNEQLQAICCLKMCNKRSPAQRILDFRARQAASQTTADRGASSVNPSGQPANSGQCQSVKACLSQAVLERGPSDHASANIHAQPSGHQPSPASLMASGSPNGLAGKGELCHSPRSGGSSARPCRASKEQDGHTAESIPIRKSWTYEPAAALPAAQVASNVR